MNKVVCTLLVYLVCEISLPALTLAADNLLMGIFPRHNAKVTVHMFKPMSIYLSEKTGKKISLVTAKNFSGFWKNVQERKYDIVHYNQLHYIESNKRPGYQVIAQNQEFGINYLRSALVVRKDSGINSIGDIYGKTVLFGGGKKAFVAYMVNSVAIHRAGLNKSDYVAKFAKNPPNATIVTYLKQADAAGIGDVGLKIPLLKKKGADVSELKIISLSAPLPHLPWAVKESMENEVKLGLQEALISMNYSAEGKSILKRAGLTGISRAEDKNYDSSRKTINELNKIKCDIWMVV